MAEDTNQKGEPSSEQRGYPGGAVKMADIESGRIKNPATIGQTTWITKAAEPV